MSPGYAVPLCRCLPDFVVSTEATTRCRRERIPTAIESAIRARFVRDSFHSLITGFPRPGNAVIRQCAVVDLASFARSGLLHRGSLLSSVSSIASRRFLCAGAPWVAHCTARARRRYLAAPPRCARSVRAGRPVDVQRRVSGGAGEGARRSAAHAAEIQSVRLSADNPGHSAVVVPPVWRLPGMVEAGILRKRDAHGSRRCFAPTARAKGAARTLICYPLSACHALCRRLLDSITRRQRQSSPDHRCQFPSPLP